MPPKAIPLLVPAQEPPEEPPKCPPKGAPAWMSTFADIAILLMAFFVLILSFAEFNQPKFKLVAGSLQLAFGVQREQPVMEQPKGTTILSLDFSPSPDVTITEQITQETTDTTQPEIVAQSEGDEEGTGSAGVSETSLDAEERQALETLADLLRQALVPDGVNVETRAGAVVVDFENTETDEVPDRLAEVAEVLSELDQTAGEATDPVLLKVLTEDLKKLASAAQAKAAEEQAMSDAQRQAAIAEAELRVALREQVDQGLVTVEQREEKVVVTVGAGGAFPSGDDRLTDQAREIMERIAFTAVDETSDIVVTGHTDSVPLTGSSPFRDNWGLAAARASSVVRELQSASGIAAGRMQALSRGETDPISDNATPEGRAENRRIEIEFQY